MTFSEMKFKEIMYKLRLEAHKSELNKKHACVAIQKGKIISPTFHNYNRAYILDYKCGSVHAEMAVMNYLINSLWRENWKEKHACIFRLIHDIPSNKNDVKLIKKLQKKFSNIELVVIRQTKARTKIGISRPCSSCLKLMKILKIKNVIYSDENGELVMEKVSHMISDHKSKMAKNMEKQYCIV